MTDHNEAFAADREEFYRQQDMAAAEAAAEAKGYKRGLVDGRAEGLREALAAAEEEARRLYREDSEPGDIGPVGVARSASVMACFADRLRRMAGE